MTHAFPHTKSEIFWDAAFLLFITFLLYGWIAGILALMGPAYSIEREVDVKKLPGSGAFLLHHMSWHLYSMNGSINLTLMDYHVDCHRLSNTMLYSPEWRFAADESHRVRSRLAKDGVFAKPSVLGFRTAWYKGNFARSTLPDVYLSYFFIGIPCWAILLTAMLWKFWTIRRRIKRRRMNARGFEVILEVNPQP